MSFFITLSSFSTGLSLLIKTRIKYMGSKDLGEDFNRGFFLYNWQLVNRGRIGIYSYDVTYITTSCPTFSKNIFNVFVVVAFGSISSASQY